MKENNVIGRVLNGRYRITERIGVGGMAEVYKAQDMVLGRILAVKVMLPQYAADPEFTTRFKHEAASAANLQNPYIVNVYDWGCDEGTYFIAMEYVRGTDLKSAINQRGAINQRKVAEIGSQVCAALSAAHGQDIMHRDIKPQNIMVQPDGNVKVMDFGIARAKNSTSQKTSAVLGTAHYISPEQAQGKELSGTSDLYSLGCVLYEAVTGKLPFDGPDAVSVAMKQVSEDPVPPSYLLPNIAPDLEAIIMKAMAKNPLDRFQTAREMKQALDEYLVGRPVSNLGAGGVRTQVIGNPATGMNGVAGGTAVMAPISGDVPTTTSFHTTSEYNAAPGRRTKRVLGVIAGLLALVAIAAGAVLLFTNMTAKVPAVPDVSGKSVEAAQEAIESAGYVVGEVTEEHDATTVAGRVIRTNPEAGTELEEGSKVDIVVSLGIAKGQVPSLEGMNAEQAEEAIRAAGLVPQYAGNEYSDVDEDLVCKQEPEAGKELDEGSSVKYWISLGTEQVEVTDVVGWNQNEAQITLQQAGFEVVIDESKYSDTVEEGIVMEQNPRGGNADKGTTIHLTVSKGKDPDTIPTDVPAVVGLDEDEAVQAMNEAGFKNLEIVYESSDVAAEGKVMRQSASGTLVPTTKITLTVSTGPAGDGE
ncbi:MAG: Stk1 family PASTA domain-containing Ser/Thr kinase [Eggerthellales bacterium]|nr:Stk1 family PASTA domain-containing Ser/Thr kinase [Eggerthellales bacterium]